MKWDFGKGGVDIERSWTDFLGPTGREDFCQDECDSVGDMFNLCGSGLGGGLWAAESEVCPT